MPGVHDQLFKELCIAFPADVVSLMMPDIASRIDLSQLRFESPECFIDSRHGLRRFPDLVGETSDLLTGDSALIHLELEYRFRTATEKRLLSYNRVVSLLSGLIVHTGVLYVRGGPAGRLLNKCEEESLGRKPTVFSYDSLGLSRASARDYLRSPWPLAWALASLMLPGSIGSRAELALACLQRIATARDLDDHRRLLLLNCVRTYVKSNKAVSEEYEKLLRMPAHQETQEMMMTWMDEIKAEGQQAGMQNLLLRQLTQRFGPLPSRIQHRIDGTKSVKKLQRLADQVLRVQSLQELVWD